MKSDTVPTFHLAVLNPGGRDQPQAFPNGAGRVEDPGHLPVNFHAYAACTRGFFTTSVAGIPAERAVLLLIGRDMARAESVLRQLKDAGCQTVVTIKETGAQQVAAAFQNAANWAAFRRLCTQADGALATTLDTLPLYQAVGGPRLPVLFLPPPYPVEEWDLSPPPGSPRSGIFIGTRQLYVTSRLHPLAVLLAGTLQEQLSEPMTVISGRASNLPPLKKLLSKLTDPCLAWHQQVTAPYPQARIISRQLPAAEYLRLMAEHKIVFQLDHSAVPGQVAGDALLCRMPCVGGNGTAERLIFPDLCGHGRSTGELMDLARRLLTEAAFAKEQVEKAEQIAREKMCFSSARRALESFYQSL
jgi:hypothetical protein